MLYILGYEDLATVCVPYDISFQLLMFCAVDRCYIWLLLENRAAMFYLDRLLSLCIFILPNYTCFRDTMLLILAGKKDFSRVALCTGKICG